MAGAVPKVRRTQPSTARTQWNESDPLSIGLAAGVRAMGIAGQISPTWTVSNQSSANYYSAVAASTGNLSNSNQAGTVANDD